MVNETTQPNSEQVLTLEEIEGSADVVRISGQSYDLASMRALGLRARSRINRLWKRISTFEEADPDKITDEDEREYESRLRELAQIALPTAPAEAIASLGPAALVDLASFFFVRAGMRSPLLTAFRSLIGGASSPSSNGSTAETPATGSTSR